MLQRYLADQIAHTNRHLSSQHALPIFRDPHQVNFEVRFRVVRFQAAPLSNSSTSRNESEYRRYQRTAHRISSGSVCRHLKIAGRIACFMIASA